MTKTISVWSRKGGVGKSTITLNLCAAATQKGLSVLLVDSDKQGSCLWLSSYKKLPFDVVDKMPNSTTQYDVIFQDCANTLDTVPLGKVVVVPYSASALDVGSVSKFLNVLNDKNKRVIEVISRVNFQRAEPKAFALDKQSKGAYIVRDRSIYVRSTGQASTVFDDDFKRTYGVNDARHEIKALLEEALA